MINSVVMVGRLVAPAEVRTTNSGTQVASFRIACDDSRRGPNNEKQSVFINVTLFGKQAETVKNYFTKGSLIGVLGRLVQRTYTNRQNIQVTTTEILADRIEFVESGNKNGANDGVAKNAGYTPDYSAPVEPAPQVAPAPQGNNLEELDVIEDDLPF